MVTALRRLAIFLLVLGLQYQLWFGEGGIVARQRLEAKMAELRAQNAALEARNERLREVIRQLETGGEALEETVRRQYNWIRSDELLFMVPEPASRP
ncbi:FtsB family cell division protein [Hydrogenophilus thiooxidans]|uniref:FtsB family cell division protein n=1 Tax=Hydrogenophilus thiooxidans TaxID=2820326 RepID=UPI001C2176C0|nr:septum formation initiator family protein [Hydrogenophilus thiooxidans]